MKINESQIEIPKEKITGYLLVRKEKNDKSGFLSSLGYSSENWEELAKDIKQLALYNDLVFQKKSEFGDLYSIKSLLKKQCCCNDMVSTNFRDCFPFYNFIS